MAAANLLEISAAVTTSAASHALLFSWLRIDHGWPPELATSAVSLLHALVTSASACYAIASAAFAGAPWNPLLHEPASRLLFGGPPPITAGPAAAAAAAGHDTARHDIRPLLLYSAGYMLYDAAAIVALHRLDRRRLRPAAALPLAMLLHHAVVAATLIASAALGFAQRVLHVGFIEEASTVVWHVCILEGAERNRTARALFAAAFLVSRFAFMPAVVWRLPELGAAAREAGFGGCFAIMAALLTVTRALNTYWLALILRGVIKAASAPAPPFTAPAPARARDGRG